MFERIFGIDIKKKAKILRARDPKFLDLGVVEYMGGHRAFPERRLSEIYFYDDRIEIDGYNLKIPYNEIKELGNSNESKYHNDAFLLGIYGLYWTQNKIYTVIKYNDGIEDQTIVLNFEKGVNQAQGLIYKKMLEVRQKGLKL